MPSFSFCTNGILSWCALTRRPRAGADLAVPMEGLKTSRRPGSVAHTEQSDICRLRQAGLFEGQTSTKHVWSEGHQEVHAVKAGRFKRKRFFLKSRKKEFFTVSQLTQSQANRGPRCADMHAHMCKLSVGGGAETRQLHEQEIGQG